MHNSNGNPSHYSIKGNNGDAPDTISYENGLPVLYTKNHKVEDGGRQNASMVVAFESGKPKMVVSGLSQKSIDRGYQLIDGKWVEDKDCAMENLSSFDCIN